MILQSATYRKICTKFIKKIFASKKEERYLATKNGERVSEEISLILQKDAASRKTVQRKGRFKSIVKLITDSAFDTCVRSFRLLQIHFLRVYIVYNILAIFFYHVFKYICEYTAMNGPRNDKIFRSYFSARQFYYIDVLVSV